MPELQFAVDGVEVVTWAPSRSSPSSSPSPRRSRSATSRLQCQIQIEPVRRRYTAEEQERLVDLFGEPSRWGETCKTMLWTHVPLTSPPFTERDRRSTCIVPCTFDFNVAVTKYLHGLDDGEVPLRFLFSGSVFFSDADGRLQITPTRLDLRGHVPAAGGRSGADDGRLLPQHRLADAARATCSTRCIGTRRTRAADVGAGDERSWDERELTAQKPPRGRRGLGLSRPCSRGVPPLSHPPPRSRTTGALDVRRRSAEMLVEPPGYVDDAACVPPDRRRGASYEGSGSSIRIAPAR